MSLLLPGIADPFGAERIGMMEHRTPTEITEMVVLSHPEQVFAPIGGTPVSEGGLAILREDALSVAEAHGFPAKYLNATAPFDRDCAEKLHGSLDISPHMAASREAWTFITCCVLPDIAAWRFPSLATERLLGDLNRNVFRRLWWRVEILGTPPELPDPVWGREDVLVNLMERPGLTGDPGLARDICHAFRDGAKDRPEAEHQELMRDLLRRLMRRSAYMSLALLEDPARHRLIEEMMNQAIAAVRSGSPPSRADEDPATGVERRIPKLRVDAVLDAHTAADHHLEQRSPTTDKGQ